MPWWYWTATVLLLVVFVAGCEMAECGRNWLGFDVPLGARLRGIDVIFTADCALLGYAMRFAGMAGLWVLMRVGMAIWRRVAGSGAVYTARAEREFDRWTSEEEA